MNTKNILWILLAAVVFGSAMSYLKYLEEHPFPEQPQPAAPETRTFVLVLPPDDREVTVKAVTCQTNGSFVAIDEPFSVWCYAKAAYEKRSSFPFGGNVWLLIGDRTSLVFYGKARSWRVEE